MSTATIIVIGLSAAFLAAMVFIPLFTVGIPLIVDRIRRGRHEHRPTRRGIN